MYCEAESYLAVVVLSCQSTGSSIQRHWQLKPEALAAQTRGTGSSNQRHWQLKPEALAPQTRGTGFTSQELPSFLVNSYLHLVFANLLLSCQYKNYLLHNYVTYLSPFLHAWQSFSHIGISLSNGDSGRDTRGTLGT